jgi:hypothetical protein
METRAKFNSSTKTYTLNGSKTWYDLATISNQRAHQKSTEIEIDLDVRCARNDRNFVDL